MSEKCPKCGAENYSSSAGYAALVSGDCHLEGGRDCLMRQVCNERDTLKTENARRLDLIWQMYVTAEGPSRKIEGSELEAVKQLRAERDALQAIVDRLKKTDDGVPLCPGDKCWVVGKDCYCDDPLRVIETIYMSDEYDEGFKFTFTAVDANTEEFWVESSWSTPEAAKAALKAVQK